jgi:hypothetical protein
MAISFTRTLKLPLEWLNYSITLWLNCSMRMAQFLNEDVNMRPYVIRFAFITVVRKPGWCTRPGRNTGQKFGQANIFTKYNSPGKSNLQISTSSKCYAQSCYYRR